MGKIRLFVAGHCGPCEEIKKLVSEGKISKEVEVIDVETDEGFALIEAFSVEGIPSAYKESQRCKLELDDEKQQLLITCPGDKEDSPESSA